MPADSRHPRSVALAAAACSVAARGGFATRAAACVAAACALLLPSPSARAQGTAHDTATPPSGACWSFSFGAWSPPLDWSASGHHGDSAAADARVRRIRDSVFVHDSLARASNAMEWERSPTGWNVVLYPTWWPAGVVIRFDGNPAASSVANGQATALRGSDSREASTTRVHAVARTCGP